MYRTLYYQHTIPITVETVAFFYCLAISFLNESLAGEGADKEIERGLGKMEVGQQCIDPLEPVAGIDEKLRGCAAGNYSTPGVGRRFESARTGSANGNDAFFLIFDI